MPGRLSGRSPSDDRGWPELHADCSSCAGLCCVALAFSASADFAIDKPAGQPCPNLRETFRCGIHAGLRDLGFPGCAVYDCHGAGQRVTVETFAGADWRADPDLAARMFAAFGTVRQLHELLWLIAAALALPATGPVHAELRAAGDETDAIARGGPDTLAALDVAAHRTRVNELLRTAGELARAGSAGPRLDRRGADLVGKDLRTLDLRGADLRGASLVGADLRGVNLALADLTGADLRGAELAGADLRHALFLGQSQLDSARGDRLTTLPPTLGRPGHWG